MVYTALLVLLKARLGSINFPQVVFLLISAQAAWEMGAELCAKAADHQQYRRYCQSVTPIPRVIFWTTALALTVLGWWAALG